MGTGVHIFRDGDPHIYIDLGTGVPEIGGPQNFMTPALRLGTPVPRQKEGLGGRGYVRPYVRLSPFKGQLVTHTCGNMQIQSKEGRAPKHPSF